MEMETATHTGATVTAMEWEKFTPMMRMRVLLVEADDSTRQIVAALLRKCSYRVEAVTDGLEAWEILREKPRNFDLILAEVDLPSISGFALLTLIMEHDICRNVPVIMMSSQGLVGNVYKCMQRGAADYLVKPIRRNELRNMWQHVWRRRSMNDDGSLPKPVNETVPLREAEATANSNQISESINRTQTNEEFIQKQTDIQISSDEEEAAKASLSSCSSLNPSPTDYAEKEISRKDENRAAKEAIDLIGTFQNYQQSHYCIDSSSHHQSLNLDYPLQLDLCLKRTAPHNDNGSLLPVKQSGANSAFSRYQNKTLHTEKELPHDFKSSDTPSPHLSTSSSILSLSNTQSQQPLPLSRDRSLPTSVPVIVLRSDNSCTDFVSECMVSQQGISQFLHSNNDGNTLESMNNSLSLDALRDKANCYPSTIGSSSAFQVTTPSEEGLIMHDGNPQQSLLQREAALMKFRLKRKLRCFDKKVRYESRKKLAEKRPRVKGQFVRHFNVDS